MKTRSDSKNIAAARVVNRMSSVINILQLKLDTITVISTKRIILYTLLMLFGIPKIQSYNFMPVVKL